MMSKPVNIAPTPGSSFSPPSLITRDWNIPPRPKPGRKPAGDAPPTKRKAQNREAQRAFRERRAARVGELEEHLKDFQQTSQREQEELTAEIKSLRDELQHFTNEMSLLRQRHADLQDSLTRERQMRLEAEAKLGMDVGSRNGDPGSSQDQSMQQLESITCGQCDSNSRCQCVEEFMANASGLDQASANFKTSNDSRTNVVNEEPVYDDNEIDFTAKFTSKAQGPAASMSKTSYVPSPRVTDPCGFCRNDTECICAAMAQENAQAFPRTLSQETSTIPAPIQTTGDRTKPTSCTNNPGNCDQCRADPTSTIFCKTLAATRASQPQTINASNAARPGGAQETAGSSEPTLSCADAFSALSRHHAFPQASQQLGSWVSQLTSVPTNAGTQGRPAFEIEAASVMTVLKFFNTRYGQQNTNGERH